MQTAPRKRKQLMASLICLSLALWGVGNVLYWEVYKGYSTCGICVWHRAVYLMMFGTALISFKVKARPIHYILFLSVIMELTISLIQVMGWYCDDELCRRISLADKLNLILVGITAFTLFLSELRNYFSKKNTEVIELPEPKSEAANT